MTNAKARAGTRGNTGGRRPLAMRADLLAAALAKRGVALARTELLLVLAEAGGLRNSNELHAMAASGELSAVAVEPLGVATLGDGTTLAAGVSSDGTRVAFDPAFAAANRYVPSPSGGILDLATIAGEVKSGRTDGPRLTLWTATIRHHHGTDVRHAWTKEAVEAKVAAYAREQWYVEDVGGDPDGMTDDEATERYFEASGEDYEVDHVVMEPVPAEVLASAPRGGGVVDGNGKERVTPATAAPATPHHASPGRPPDPNAWLAMRRLSRAGRALLEGGPVDGSTVDWLVHLGGLPSRAWGEAHAASKWDGDDAASLHAMGGLEMATALGAFADCVFDDNGDLTVSTTYLDGAATGKLAEALATVAALEPKWDPTTWEGVHGGEAVVEGRRVLWWDARTGEGEGGRTAVEASMLASAGKAIAGGTDRGVTWDGPRRSGAWEVVGAA